jgi:arginine deiminase
MGEATAGPGSVQGGEGMGSDGGLRAGVFSEVGRLGTVLVCRPGLAHRRLTPRGCRELQFDAPLWVERAQGEFDTLVQVLRHHGVEVLELHELLARTLESSAARAWLLEQTLSAGALGFDAPEELQLACAELDAARLAELLLGGLTLADLGLTARGALAAVAALHPYLLAPLPHTLFMREAGSWVQHGVALGRPNRPGPRREALLLAAVYRFHPRFAASPPPLWWGGPDQAAGCGCAEGGDIMALGHSVVLIGVGERTQPQAALQIARALFDGGVAKTVITAHWPRGGALAGAGTRPLARVFTHCAPDVVTYNADVVDHMECRELRTSPQAAGVQVRAHAGRHLLDVLSEALDVPTFHAIPTGSDDHAAVESGAAAWDDGTGALAVAPGVVIGFERNTRTNQRLRQAGVEVVEIPGSELGRAGATAHALCCPIARRALN